MFQIYNSQRFYDAYYSKGSILLIADKSVFTVDAKLPSNRLYEEVMKHLRNPELCQSSPLESQPPDEEFPPAVLRILKFFNVDAEVEFDPIVGEDRSMTYTKDERTYTVRFKGNTAYVFNDQTSYAEFDLEVGKQSLFWALVKNLRTPEGRWNHIRLLGHVLPNDPPVPVMMECLELYFKTRVIRTVDLRSFFVCSIDGNAVVAPVDDIWRHVKIPLADPEREIYYQINNQITKPRAKWVEGMPFGEFQPLSEKVKSVLERISKPKPPMVFVERVEGLDGGKQLKLAAVGEEGQDINVYVRSIRFGGISVIQDDNSGVDYRGTLDEAGIRGIIRDINKAGFTRVGFAPLPDRVRRAFEAIDW